jgi:hypothetical protein
MLVTPLAREISSRKTTKYILGIALAPALTNFEAGRTSGVAAAMVVGVMSNNESTAAWPM